MTLALPFCIEVLVLAVDPVRLLVLPLVIVARSSLKLMAIVSVDFFRVDLPVLSGLLGRHDRDG
jgi:hypothetical protein